MATEINRERFYTPTEAALFMGFTAATIRHRIHAGRLPALRIGGRLLITEKDLRKLQREEQLPELHK